MGRAIGYMLTWNTYGSWLQGDSRGWVKDGRRYGENRGLYEANVRQMTDEVMCFNAEQKEAVREALIVKGEELGQEVLAISVLSNHVHILLRYVERPLPSVAQMYKRAGTTALRKIGVKGRVWGGKYSVRNCFDGEGMGKLLEYVRGHEAE